MTGRNLGSDLFSGFRRMSEKSLVQKKGDPFVTEEQTKMWLDHAMVSAEPERVPVYMRASKEELCELRGIETDDDFARHFTATAEPNVYQSGSRPGHAAIRRNTHTPFWGPVAYLKEATGPSPRIALHEFWKLEDVGTTPDFDSDDLLIELSAISRLALVMTLASPSAMTGNSKRSRGSRMANKGTASKA